MQPQINVDVVNNRSSVKSKTVAFVSSVFVGCLMAEGQLFNLFVEKTESLSQYATLLHHKLFAE